MPRNSAMYFCIVAGIPRPPRLVTTAPIHATKMMYPIFDAPRVRPISIEVKSVTSALTRFSRPYQPVLRAMILVLDICAQLAFPVFQSRRFKGWMQSKTIPRIAAGFVGNWRLQTPQRHPETALSLRSGLQNQCPGEELVSTAELHPSIVQPRSIER